MIPGNLGSLAGEGSWTSCPTGAQAVGDPWLWWRGRATRKWAQSGCLFSGCNVPLFIGRASSAMTYSGSFAKSGCMLSELFSLTKWFLSSGRLRPTAASFREWLTRHEPVWEIKQQVNQEMLFVLWFYLIWVEGDPVLWKSSLEIRVKVSCRLMNCKFLIVSLIYVDAPHVALTVK